MDKQPILGYRIVGNYYISDLCMQTAVCKHFVLDCDAKNKRMMDGREIFTMLKNDKCTMDPHFNCYNPNPNPCRCIII
jgi:hypothetical protein